MHNADVHTRSMLGEREGAAEAELVIAVLRQAIMDARSLSMYDHDRIDAVRFLQDKSAVVGWLQLIGLDDNVYLKVLQWARIEV